MITVLVADDHPVMRHGLAALLNSYEDISVVAIVADGHEAVKEVVLTRPDVAMLDLHMPGTDGYAALREIARLAPDTACCVLTMLDDDESLVAAIRAGARGYLLKGAEQEDIVRAVRAIASGEAVFGSSVAGRVLQRLTSPTPAARPFPELSARELQVLDLMASGHNTTSIAQSLGIAVKTVNNTISIVLGKLGASDRIQAAVMARDAGLGGMPRG